MGEGCIYEASALLRVALRDGGEGGRGRLRRREARDLVKIDVNKTSRVWDFLVQAGFLKVGAMDVPATAAAAAAGTGGAGSATGGGGAGEARSVNLAS